MTDLFSVSSKVNIIELTSVDVAKCSDNYNIAYELIRKHQEKYPDIERWFKKKVAPGIMDNSRSAFIGFENDKPIATAVVKKGEDSKFCHLYIEEDLRHQNIGDVFFILMSMYVKDYANKVHFSLPEGLWEEKKKFFNSFGFNNIEKCHTQYRSFEEELTTSTSIKTLWNNIIAKLPGLLNQFNPFTDDILNGIVMSIQPKYTSQIMKGKKEIEIRRKFNTKWINHKVTIYSSSPVQEIIGYATIKDVIEESPVTIWEKYSKQIGCSKSEFEGYTHGLDKAYAIVLGDINEYSNKISLSHISDICNQKFRPPQSYSSVGNTEWKNAISVAEILHGRLHIATYK